MSQDLNMGKDQAHTPILKFKLVVTIVFYCEKCNFFIGPAATMLVDACGKINFSTVENYVSQGLLIQESRRPFRLFILDKIKNSET